MVKNIVRYCILLGLAMLIFIEFGGRTPFLMVAVLIVMPFISVALCRKMGKNMGVILEFEKDMIGRGGVNTLKVGINNKYFVPTSGCTVTINVSNVYYDKSKTFKLDIPVEGRGISYVNLDVSSPSSGYVIVGKVNMTLTDMFGMFNFTMEKDKTAKYMVLPSAVCVDETSKAFVADDEAEEDMHEIGEDTSEIEDIREYIPGDRMQRIHWKLSGKMEELMVKEYAKNYDIDVSLVCELFIDDKCPNLDPVLDALYSVMQVLNETNERYTFYFINKTHDGVMSIDISSDADVLEALAQMYYIKPYDENGLATSFVQSEGVTHPMCIRFKNDNDVPGQDIITEFDDKVVLVWG